MTFLGATLSIVAVLANGGADNRIAKQSIANHQSSRMAPNGVSGVAIECSPVDLTYEVGGQEQIGQFNGCQTQSSYLKNRSSDRDASGHE